MEAARKPSAGVIVIAVLDFLGSALCLLMGIFMLAIPAIAPAPQTPSAPFPPGAFKAMMIVGSLFYFGPAIWGILTGIGLFRLRGWARISIIVFSVLMMVMAGFCGLMMVLIPLPTPPGQAVDPAFTTVFRVVAACASLFFVSMGAWWLVFFTRAKVKQQFEQAQPAIAGVAIVPEIAAVQTSITSGPNRTRAPISLTIIACLMLVGCLYMPFVLFMHSPAILFTKVVTGWAAEAYYVAVLALCLYIGIGLLRLWPNACKIGIFYQMFLLINLAVFYLVPGGRSRMLELLERSQATSPWAKLWTGEQTAFHVDIMPFVWIGMVVGLVTVLVQLYFLITRRSAFEAAAAAHREAA